MEQPILSIHISKQEKSTDFQHLGEPALNSLDEKVPGNMKPKQFSVFLVIFCLIIEQCCRKNIKTWPISQAQFN